MKRDAQPHLHLESLRDASVAYWLHAEQQLAREAARKPRDQAALVAAEAAAAELYNAVRRYALVSPRAAWRALSKSEGPQAAGTILSMLPPLSPQGSKHGRNKRASPKRRKKKKSTRRAPKSASRRHAEATPPRKHRSHAKSPTAAVHGDES